MTRINLILAPKNRLHGHVHTFIHSTSVDHTFRHEVAIVLSGPPTGTRGFSRDHDNRVFSRNVAYSTGSIVLFTIRHKKIFILSSIHVTITLYSSSKRQGVFWVIRHAHIISCSSLVAIVGRSSSSRIYTFHSTATSGLPPPVVRDSTSRGSWGSS
jgi:hypothetical protein